MFCLRRQRAPGAAADRNSVPEGSGRSAGQPYPGSLWGAGPQCSELANLACVHCAHFGLRIGSYVDRIGLDSAGFRGSPVLAGEGMQFESHLGHSVSAGQGLFRRLVLTKLDTSQPLMHQSRWNGRFPIRPEARGFVGIGAPPTIGLRYDVQQMSRLWCLAISGGCCPSRGYCT
jgi:hypothetical protein